MTGWKSFRVLVSTYSAVPIPLAFVGTHAILQPRLGGKQNGGRWELCFNNVGMLANDGKELLGNVVHGESHSHSHSHIKNFVCGKFPICPNVLPIIFFFFFSILLLLGRICHSTFATTRQSFYYAYTWMRFCPNVGSL